MSTPRRDPTTETPTSMSMMPDWMTQSLPTRLALTLDFVT
ncbi:hypothetical protein FVEN_g12861 [Fusarium venenatum]|nr:hypothetical protein FVEN_g12861 [Fusarium venenatum]